MHKQGFRKQLKAFSLIEVSVIIGAFFSISLIALPIAINQIQTTRASTAMKDVKSAMFLTEQDAYTRKDNASYGVAFSEHGYTVFKGASLATATDYDEFDFTTDVIIENVNFNSNNELVFPVGSFRPQNAGTVEVRNGIESYRITISSEGLITAEKI